MKAKPTKSALQRAGLDLIRMQAVLELLLDAYELALRTRQDRWEFAVEIETLRTAHGTPSDLRLLVSLGYLAHAIETTWPQSGHRSFQGVTNLALSARSCFVLTESGVQLARNLRATADAADWSNRLPAGNTPLMAEPGNTPHWDRFRRELRVAGVVVKHFRVPAPNQEAILTAFEEERWPPHIDDPLPPRAGLDSKERLHEAISRLNRNQRHRLILFHGDGTGRGICWELYRRRP
jgi:hypothetical protein